MIVDLLFDKNDAEKADIKAIELMKLDVVGMYEDFRYNVTIEIQSLEKFYRGVAVYIRAWRDGKQLGFGEDGSVEIEKIRIFNPPILVPDPLGTVVRSSKRDKGESDFVQTYREDPLEALRLDVAHTVHLIGKADTIIQIGKVGQTTTTVYPDAGDPGATTIDGRCMYNGASITFSSLRAASGTDADSTTLTSANFALIEATTTTDQYDSLRCFFGNFDTSVVGSDQSISAATLSLFGTAKTNGFTTIDNSLNIISSNTAADNTLAASDFQTRGTTSFGSIDHASFSTTAYNDIALNASGIANINKTGVSKFAATLGCDVNNTAPTWVSSAATGLTGNYADQAGTTNDPKLVITHATAAAASTPGNNLLFMGVG